MLSERERRTLAVMERWLRRQDPEFTGSFEDATGTGAGVGQGAAPGSASAAGAGRRPAAGWLLLFIGLLAALGSGIAGLPVVTLALICALLAGAAVALVMYYRTWRVRRH